MNIKTMEASNRLTEWLYRTNGLSNHSYELKILNVQIYSRFINIVIKIEKKNSIKVVDYLIFNDEIHRIKKLSSKTANLKYKFN